MEQTISLDRDVVHELTPYLEEKHVSQPLLVSTILKDILFAEKYAKTDQNDIIVEQFLVDLYRAGILEYKDLLSVLGFEMSLEVANTTRTTKRFRSWTEKIVRDTSAIITVFSAGHLSGNEDCYLREIGSYRWKNISLRNLLTIKHTISEYMVYGR